MIHWGVSAGTHDASLSVVKDGEILFASHSERFSGIKNDKNLNPMLVDYALLFGEPDIVHWYENPYLKATRKIFAKQSEVWLNPKKYLSDYDVDAKIKYAGHHQSHKSRWILHFKIQRVCHSCY